MRLVGLLRRLDRSCGLKKAVAGREQREKETEGNSKGEEDECD